MGEAQKKKKNQIVLDNIKIFLPLINQHRIISGAFSMDFVLHGLFSLYSSTIYIFQVTVLVLIISFVFSKNLPITALSNYMFHFIIGHIVYFSLSSGQTSVWCCIHSGFLPQVKDSLSVVKLHVMCDQVCECAWLYPGMDRIQGVTPQRKNTI